MSDGLTRRVLGLSVPVTELLDPALWRERYAFGVALGPDSAQADAPNNALLELMCRKTGSRTKGAQLLEDTQSILRDRIDGLPDDMIRWHLRAAMSELEVKLGMPMGVTVYKSDPVDEGLIQGQHYDVQFPRMPFTREQANTWYRFDLPSNVISIDRVRLYWYDQLVWLISSEADNLNLVQLEHPKQGSGHILPTTNSNVLISAPGLANGNYGAYQLLNSTAMAVPSVWSIDFTCGPRDQYGGVGRVEAVLAHWVYAAAGILLLSIGGLARSQGLTSASVSMDGLSRSVGLQASAIYGVNSALENALKEATKRIDWKALRTYKQGLRVLSYKG